MHNLPFLYAYSYCPCYTVYGMVWSMNEVQEAIASLQAKGWTLAAIADELEITVNAVEKWKAGQRTPANRKSMLEHLGRLLQQRHVPPQRRYQKGARADGTQTADAHPTP